MTSFTFVTQSSNKIAEVERILGIKLEYCYLNLPEIQAVEVEEVIAHKVKYAYEALGKKPVMIEDTGLFIEAWNGLPGALTKWFVERLGATGICSMMHEFSNKNAWAKTIVATYDGQLRIFTGKVEGRIAPVPSGDGGFGWDKVFIPNGAVKTFAEMSPDEKDKYSMRRLALEATMTYYSQSQAIGVQNV
ncbi:MAG: non-canonical purine NTP pyrophosphatase, RdgB/HAM1 family [Chloroflexi bacterium]|nr:non-canonical purine NTP pyrophosphatase, RdgB/HAM1 family [Chloroflexota bacterium]